MYVVVTRRVVNYSLGHLGFPQSKLLFFKHLFRLHDERSFERGVSLPLRVPYFLTKNLSRPLPLDLGEIAGRRPSPFVLVVLPLDPVPFDPIVVLVVVGPPRVLDPEPLAELPLGATPRVEGHSSCVATQPLEGVLEVPLSLSESSVSVASSPSR